MKKEGFFKPNLTKIAIFIVLVIISFVILSGTPIFPCKTRVVMPGAEFRDGVCTAMALPPGVSLLLRGVDVVYSPVSYVIYFVLVLLVPYLLSCFLFWIFKKK